MSPSELNQKTEDILSKFKNGEVLYRNSALFNRSVQTLVRGIDPYELIEQLIFICEDAMTALESKIVRDNKPSITFDEFNKTFKS